VTEDPNRSSRARDRRSTDLPAGGGVPPWLGATITHCARCGGALELRTVAGEERPRLVCSG